MAAHLQGSLALLAACAAASLAACQSQPEPHQSQAPTEVAAPVAQEEPLPARALVIAKTPPTGSERPRDYRRFNAYLGAAIEHPVVVQTPATYEAAIGAVVSGAAHFALLSPLAYVEAKEREPQLRLLASILREGQTHYLAYIVVGEQSPIRDIRRLRGKRFAFGDPASTSGTLFPMAMLLDVGIDPNRDFAAAESHADHREILERVQEGLVDAGAISSTTFRHLSAESPSHRARVIAKSEPIPYDAFVAHPQVPASVAARMGDALLQLSTRTDEGRQILRGLILTAGFIAAKDETYDSIRRVQARLAAARP